MSAGRSALRRGAGARVGWRRMPASARRTASCWPGLAISPTALATLGMAAVGMSGAGIAAAWWATKIAAR
ncbi:hypothetical protein ACTXG6_33660 [Pseudonocardia sp. Cha107L01]|uniref:hypothetical protein n=1 Tax=Pseudonocardia sp. Cha107L01 TaxID=3457576 RepID=UPI00403E7077